MATFTPINTTDQSVMWTSDAPLVATVDASTGEVTGVAVGEANVYVTTTDGSFTDTCVVTVIDGAISVTGITVDPQATELDKLDSLTITPTFAPISASDKGLTWTSLSPAGATVDTDGEVKAVALGTALIIAETTDGGFKDTCVITVVQKAYLSFDSKANYIDPNTFQTGGLMEVTVNYAMGANRVINASGITFWLRQMLNGGTTGTDYKFEGTSYAGTKTGTATESIDLTGAILTADLPTGGWYWLWIIATDNMGTPQEAKSTWLASEVLIVASTPTGLQVQEHRLSVYPNPAENTLFLDGLQGDVKASVFTLDGRQMMTRQLGATRQMDVSQLERGNYILQVQDEIGVNAQMISIK